MMIIARVSSSSSSVGSLAMVLLAALCFLTPTTVVQAVGEVCGPLVVRGIFNEGYITPHKNCTDADFELVKEAVRNAETILVNRRELRVTGQGQRVLPVHCPSFCRNYPQPRCIPFGCPGDYDDDDRRMLTNVEQEDEDMTIVVLDDYFNDVTDNGRGPPRKLGEEICGITEARCIEYKSKLYQAVLSSLGDISHECANLLLSPSLLQCIVAIE